MKLSIPLHLHVKDSHYLYYVAWSLILIILLKLNLHKKIKSERGNIMKELLVSNVEEVEEVEGYQVDPKAACD